MLAAYFILVQAIPSFGSADPLLEAQTRVDQFARLASIPPPKVVDHERPRLFAVSDADGRILVRAGDFAGLPAHQRAAALAREVSYIALGRERKGGSRSFNSVPLIMRDVFKNMSHSYGIWRHDHRLLGLRRAEELLREVGIPASSLVDLLKREAYQEGEYSLNYSGWTGGEMRDLIWALRGNRK